ncbi:MULTISPECIES: four helix bundle protein [Pseudomonas]|uniref:four helix bundle protein n=1 Tax=Pseudomonas TaxID=286 RepID=UPI000D97B1DD|nr:MULTISPECIES: four helix bundle protein [Pseudomonas]MBH3385405.1 four helix bundle protein [Pseudomonas juntendi]MBR7521867.1 four helix bundle protein [Pseudomonas juntendi]PYC10369.1 four helix bundle protein [Pseudomonas sp. MB-090624]WBM31957.1 four helix bundle protein [Pseudomonas sp. NY11382]
MGFEKLLVWQRSKNLAVAIYRAFAGCRDFGFRSQITRAAVSVPSNIAEGMERRGMREKAWFLSVAKASCAELRTQLIIAGEIGYLPAELANDWITETRELSRMLAGLINKISN